MLATLCPQQVVRVGFVEFGERHDTRTNGQQYTAADRSARGKLNGEVARHARHARHPRSILVTSYQDVARVGRVHEDTTGKLLP